MHQASHPVNHLQKFGRYSAFWIVLATFLSVVVYILLYDPVRFYYEAWGTWILSPGIVARLCPYPFNWWIYSALNKNPMLLHLICAVPVCMLFTSLVLGFKAIEHNSAKLAIIAAGLVCTVLSVYHHVQPYGITLVWLD